MSFQTGLSGLNSSSKNLDVIGNNIANANTVGMKSSRTEFAELVASGGGGFGVAVNTVTQDFGQGDISQTGNSLDMAINGAGFFQVTKPDGSTAFTRDGQFKLDKDGNIVSNTGANLMGYATDATGSAIGGTVQKLSLPTTAPVAANATTTIKAELNLDARALTAAQAATAGVSADPRSKYGTSISVYDAQGVPTSVNLYFEKASTNSWNVYQNLTLPGTSLGTVTFDASGKATAPTLTGGGIGLTLPANTITSANPNTPVIPPATVATLPQAITLKLDGVTQFGVPFAVSNLSQDGYTSGVFTGLNIDGNGVITTRYSNGQSLKTGGMVALADFRNDQGLAALGSGEYVATNKSGPAILGKSAIGQFGELRTGALEQSNVDLTAELINMMTAQRNYQANAQTIKTQDQVMSTLVNLR
jgi:flagellar hook protein FlgE